MKTKFENLVKKASLLTGNELSDACIELADDLKNVSSDMFSISKKSQSRGAWVSTSFANSYYFGDVLSRLIIQACNGIRTFDEDKVFNHEDVKEHVADVIFDYIYCNEYLGLPF